MKLPIVTTTPKASSAKTSSTSSAVQTLPARQASKSFDMYALVPRADTDLVTLSEPSAMNAASTVFVTIPNSGGPFFYTPGPVSAPSSTAAASANAARSLHGALSENRHSALGAMGATAMTAGASLLLGVLLCLRNR